MVTRVTRVEKKCKKTIREEKFLHHNLNFSFIFTQAGSCCRLQAFNMLAHAADAQYEICMQIGYKTQT